MAYESRFRLWPRRDGDAQSAEQSAVQHTEQQVTTVQESYQYNTDIPAAYFGILREGGLRGAPYSPFEISRMARDPMRNIDAIREWARWAYYSNGTISTAIDSLQGLHTLDYVVVTKPKRVGVERINYKDYHQIVNRVLRTIRYKDVIRDAIYHEARDGMYFGYFENRSIPVDRKKALTDYEMDSMFEINESGASMCVIPLPVDHCRIIGRRGSTYEIAFDLRFFDGLPEEEIKRRILGMPKQIQEGYRQYKNGNFSNGASWLRLDWRRTIVGKIKSGARDPFGVPFAVAALDDVDYARYFVNSKRNVLDTVNNQIYYETFPEGKDKGTSALSEKQQTHQHNVVKQALTTRRNNNGVSFFSLAAGTKMDHLPVDIDLLDEDNENAIKEDINKSLGFSAAALNGSSSGNYATASLNLELVASRVFTWIEEIAEELNKCIALNVIKDKDHVAEFRMLPITFVKRDQFVKFYSDLYARGKGSLSAWIAATGVNADDYISLMDYELDEDFENKYPVHKTSFTVTGKDAPEYEDVDNHGDLDNPSTASTVANNGNALPSPSD